MQAVMPETKTLDELSIPEYAKLSQLEKLACLTRARELPDPANPDYNVAENQAFLEGRMMEVTISIDEHPEWYEWDCLCGTCLEYGD